MWTQAYIYCVSVGQTWKHQTLVNSQLLLFCEQNVKSLLPGCTWWKPFYDFRSWAGDVLLTLCVLDVSFSTLDDVRHTFVQIIGYYFEQRQERSCHSIVCSRDAIPNSKTYYLLISAGHSYLNNRQFWIRCKYLILANIYSNYTQIHKKLCVSILAYILLFYSTECILGWMEQSRTTPLTGRNHQKKVQQSSPRLCLLSHL